MWSRVAVVRTDIPDKPIDFKIRMTEIGEIEATLPLISNRIMYAI
jgi:hypothetical protein